MKILQLNNTACVPLTIARHLRTRGFEVDVVQPIFSRSDDIHIRGVTDVIIIGGDQQSMVKWIVNNGGKYDIIHVHAILEYIPLIRSHFPNTPIVFTGHGTNVRERWKFHEKIMDMVNYITVSTSELLEGSPSKTDYIPNVADPTLWKRKNKAIKNLALYKYFGRPLLDENRIKNEATEYSKRKKWTLNLHNRMLNPLPYNIYPRYLEKYGIFFDFRFLSPNHYKNINVPLSYTAIQFLSLGGNKVIHNFGKEYTELPKEFNFNEIMGRWYEIYNGVI